MKGNFVIYANAKGMLIAPNVSYCFAIRIIQHTMQQMLLIEDSNYSLIRELVPLIL